VTALDLKKKNRLTSIVAQAGSAASQVINLAATRSPEYPKLCAVLGKNICCSKIKILKHNANTMSFRLKITPLRNEQC